MTNIAHDEVKAARKAHVCDWCNEAIEIGQPYVRQRNKDGRDVWTWRAHPECSKAASTLDSFDLEMVAGETMTRGCTCPKGSGDGDYCDHRGMPAEKAKAAGGVA